MKASLKINILLFLLALPFINWVITTKGWAYQGAVITSEKATVYADKKCNVPVGYLVKDTGVLVGNQVRFNSVILPAIVEGKVTYLKSTDLRLLSSNDFQELKKRTSEEENKDNKVLSDDKFSLHRYADFTEKEKDRNNQMMVTTSYQQVAINKLNEDRRENYYTLGLEGWNKEKFYGINLSLFHMQSDTSDYNFKAYGVESGVHLALLRLAFISLLWEGSLMYAPFVHAMVVRDPVAGEAVRFRGNFYGYHTGPELSINIKEWFDIRGSATYLNIKERLSWRDSTISEQTDQHMTWTDGYKSNISFKAQVGVFF